MLPAHYLAGFDAAVAQGDFADLRTRRDLARGGSPPCGIGYTAVVGPGISNYGVRRDSVDCRGTPIRSVMGLIAASKIDFVLDIVKRLWARANPTRWKGIASNGHPAPICFGPRITAATYGCDAFQLA